MKPRLIICEGADNCGKSTLAKTIAKHFHGVYWRLTSGPGLSAHDAMSLYQWNALDNAEVNILNNKLVVLDRHWPSDQVYGRILRDKPSTSGEDMLGRCRTMAPIYIYCFRHNAVQEHAKAKDPDHPYEDTVYRQVLQEYEDFFNWLEYDKNQTVLRYYLDNFIGKPEQTAAFLNMLETIP